MKRIISVILALLSISMLASCRRSEVSEGEGTNVTDIGTSEVTSGTETSETDVPTSDEITEYEGPGDILAEETEADTETEPASSETETAEPAEDTTAPIPDTMTEDKAVTLARDFLGEKDPDTGYTYSFRFDSVNADGDYVVRVFWYLEEDERWAECGEVLVTPDGKVSKYNW